MGKIKKSRRKSSRRNPERLEALLRAIDNIQREDIQDWNVYVQLRVVEARLLIQRR